MFPNPEYSPKSKYSPLILQDSDRSTCVPALAELLSDIVYKCSRWQRGVLVRRKVSACLVGCDTGA